MSLPPEMLYNLHNLRPPDARSLRAPEFLRQNEFLNDVLSRFKAINCTRRAGKSEGEVISHIECALQFPGSRQLYGGLTLDSVTEIVWDIFKDKIKKGKIAAKFNETKKIIFFKNSSRVRLFGLDSSHREMRKILGQKLRKVSIDEAGSMTIDMAKVCYQMIRPALIDLSPNSWLTLLGTCENIPNTFFERVTEGREPGWKVHKWTAYENPFMAKQWEAEIKDILAKNPLIINASWFKTHYLNQWCSDDDLIIIPVSRAQYAPFLPPAKYHYVLGVDLGYSDASSFAVLAYSEQHKKCYIVETFKDTEMTFTEVAAKVNSLNLKYNFEKIIVDGANKQGVEEMRKRKGIPFHNAEKQDKATFLHMMRDDVITGNLVMIQGTTAMLHTEWASLMWKDTDKQEEDPRCQNHLSDATLYAWRECRHYTYEPPNKEADQDSTEYIEALEEKLAEQIENQEEEAWWESQKAA